MAKLAKKSKARQSKQAAQESELYDYDTDAVVIALARGDMTYGQIAKMINKTESYVGQLSRGERRPELQVLINAYKEGFIEHAKRLAAAKAHAAIESLVELATGEIKVTETKRGKIKMSVDPEVRRKACGDLLGHSLGDPSRPEINVNQSSGTHLDAEDLENLAAMKGGPQ